MSSKSTILLTNDNEHWYKEANNKITLEFSKKNISIDINDNDDLVISIINPNSELYSTLLKLKEILQ